MVAVDVIEVEYWHFAKPVAKRLALSVDLLVASQRGLD